MRRFSVQFITDDAGQKIAAVLMMKDFEDILEELEELEDIRAFDEATQSNEPSIPADEVFRMIEEKRKSK